MTRVITGDGGQSNGGIGEQLEGEWREIQVARVGDEGQCPGYCVEFGALVAVAQDILAIKGKVSVLKPSSTGDGRVRVRS
jgi:hypothetical protein